MKKVLILTDLYPYEKGESFLSNELIENDYWNEIFVASLFSKKNDRAFCFYPNPSKNIHVLPPGHNPPLYLAPLLLVQALFSPLFWNDYNSHRNRYGHRISSFKIEIVFFCRGIFQFHQLRKIVRKNDIHFIYSYWLSLSAFVGSLLKHESSKLFFFCRAHRGDLYEELRPCGFIPMRKFVIQQLDWFFPISSDGCKYLSTEFPELKGKTSISRLGTKDYGPHFPPPVCQPFRIVSCSFLRPVKRVSLLISALKELNLPIEWYHFGDGEEKDRLIQLASSLPGNIKAHFMGFCSNGDVMSFYRSQPVNLFINVSASEGIPVSVMEAMSFGIPIIATDVGGTKEIVDSANGILLPADTTIEKLAQGIVGLLSLPAAQYTAKCKNSRLKWEKLCNGTANLRDFHLQIDAIDKKINQ